MSSKKSDIGREFEGLFKKAIDINTQYFKEGTKIMKRMNSSGSSGTDLNFLRPEKMAGAFTEFAKMNLEHYQNVLDLGLKLTQQAVSDESGETAEADSELHYQSNAPAFELTGTIKPEGSVTLDFLLDNTLEDEVRCQFKNSEFVRDEDSDTQYSFRTAFSPQSFVMPKGGSRKISVVIEVDDRVPPGSYTCRVEVLGFEPLFFLIKLNIPEKPTQKAGNGKKKNKK